MGAFRLLDRLASRGIAPAVLLNTEIYDHAPALMAAVRAAGAEIVAHGKSNSDTLHGMAPAEEGAYIRDVADAIERAEGAAPAGWSSPWLTHTEVTFDLLAEAGFRYVLDLRMDDQPVWLATRQGRLLAIPYGLELNDSSTIIGRKASAQEFAQMIIDEFDELLEAADAQPVVMSVVVHSFISGQPFRLRALTRALDHIAAHRDRIWLTQPEKIAEWAAETRTWSCETARAFPSEEKMSASLLTPLLADDSPLDARSRALVVELFEAEARLMSALPSDDPLDAKRRRRVDLTRPEILAQPQAIRATLAGARDATVDAAGVLARAGIRRIVMTGCGDSLAVMIAARLFFEQLLGVPCEPVQALDVAYYGYGRSMPQRCS